MLKTKRDQGVFAEMMFYTALSLLSLVLNIWLYVDDLKYRGAVLSSVDKIDSE